MPRYRVERRRKKPEYKDPRGRKNAAFDEPQAQMAVILVTEDPRISGLSMARRINSALPWSHRVSPRSCREFKAGKFQRVALKRVCPLTPEHKIARVRAAWRYLRADHSRFLMLDEKTFTVCCTSMKSKPERVCIRVVLDANL